MEVFFIYIPMSICSWKIDERPREKMNAAGAGSLNDSELLAVIINSGTKDKSAVDVARNLLSTAGNSLRNLSQLSIEQLCTIPGIGKAKASKILAAFALASRVQSESAQSMPTIYSAKDVVRILGPLVRDLKHEECWVLYLNKGNKLIGKERLSIGGIAATIIDARIIIKKAVEKLASSIIIVHNHPSGNPRPGDMDRRQTRHLKEAASILDIALLDHVIIAGNQFYSFSEENS